MTSTNEIEVDPAEIARLIEVPAVKAAWDLFQEARNNQNLAAGGPSAGRLAVEQARHNWVVALRTEAERMTDESRD